MIHVGADFPSNGENRASSSRGEKPQDWLSRSFFVIKTVIIAFRGLSMKIGFDENMSLITKIRVIFKMISSFGLIIAVLFISTGRWDYWQGWLYFLLWIYNYLFTYITIPSELVKERAKPGVGTKKWDSIIGFSIILLIYIVPLIAALDGWRYHWTRNFPLWVNALAFVMIFLGYSLTNISVWTNRFFSSTVRIQKERGHYVIDKGPYAFIRHPGYTGLIISFFAVGFALNSFWALVPAGLFSGVLIIRTYLEDVTLQKELLGYIEYTARVRYRLVPGIW
jgi:protein-S-isoprenylcysteine O-methyltransferase Ste14